MASAPCAHRLRQLVHVCAAGLTLTALLWVALQAARCAAGVAGAVGCNSGPVLLSSLVTALGFWVIGTAAWAGPQPGPAAAFFWLVAATLATGALSATQNYSAGRLFNLALSWLAPLVLAFHLHLLDRPLSRPERRLIYGSSALAALWTLCLLRFDIPQMQAAGFYAWLRLGVRLTLVLALAIGLATVWRGFRTGLTAPAKRRTQLLLLGSLLAFAPLLMLSLVPETLRMPLYVPYEATFPWLLLSPISYLYAGYRARLTRVERTVRHAAGYFLLAVIFLTIFLWLVALLRVPPLPGARWLLVGAALSGLAVLVVAAWYPQLLALAERSLSGQRISDALLGKIAEQLSQAHDLDVLRRLLVENVGQAFRAPVVLLLVREGDYFIGQLAPALDSADGVPVRLPASSRVSAALLESPRPLRLDALRRRFAAGTWEEGETPVMTAAGLELLAPLRSGGVLYGILGLGGKLTEDPWRQEDLAALTVLGWQAGAALQNLHLLAEVQAGRDGLARAHRQSLAEQDRQERELAQALHDGPVQQLLGLSYLLAETPASHPAAGPNLPAMRSELLAIVAQLRDLIGRLRPAGLEELGIGPALRDYAGRLQRTVAEPVPRVRLHIAPQATQLPLTLSQPLFRVAQEGLRNALRHARATVVVVELRVESEVIRLTIEDDGCGFVVPQRLSDLAQSNHYGLVGIAERVEWLGGRLELRSQPGGGTLLAAAVPLARAEGDDHVQRDNYGPSGG